MYFIIKYHLPVAVGDHCRHLGSWNEYQLPVHFLYVSGMLKMSVWCSCVLNQSILMLILMSTLEYTSSSKSLHKGYIAHAQRRCRTKINLKHTSQFCLNILSQLCDILLSLIFWDIAFELLVPFVYNNINKYACYRARRELS